ncbi:hypothetical protein [Microbulbifer spongiae]|uniref:Uncharacterized protein n=1 Tax=Microbulbifer spongiae TaxID=2944933 RepID=A0ABY9EJH1_9GAMM|nr:hypothetical protein [Microbulbifer sp. MI-G]WKD51411.1 hypothetical protein M8T91_08315 [Microbulbifer sp. MI-G]
MRYLVSLVLLFSLAGFSYAQERLTQLPSNAATVQILGKTYYQSGNTFYRFDENTRYFYQVQPPTVLPRYQQPTDMSVRGMWHRPEMGLTQDQIEGCRNAAADKSNANPSIGGKIYIREYHRCIGNLR